jgi:hypothetical protein
LRKIIGTHWEQQKKKRSFIISSAMDVSRYGPSEPAATQQCIMKDGWMDDKWFWKQFSVVFQFP